MPQFFDTHAHVQFNAYKDDGHEIITRTLKEGTWMNLIGSQIDTSRRAVKYAEQYDAGVYALVALHPTHLFSHIVDEDEIQFKSREEVFDYDAYRALTHSKKVVGIGECGLEYFRLDQYKESVDAIKKKQHDAFDAQIQLALETNLPIAIHCREAYDEVYEMIKNRPGLRGLMHCYLGTWEQAKRFLDLGFFISFSGIVTFKNAKALQEVARQVPLEQMVIETDCPYLTPEPHRGKRNEPLYVEYVARKIAELKGGDVEEIAQKTTKNALKLFGISAEG
jgi:TatD DNase family protein